MSENILPDPATPFGGRVRERLRGEKVIWLTTVGADGSPQPNPVWFLWYADTNDFVVMSRVKAHRLAHIRQRPKVSLNFDGNGRGGNIIVLRGTATLDDGGLTDKERADYNAKYGPDMKRVSGSIDEFRADYPVTVRIKLTNVRGF